MLNVSITDDSIVPLVFTNQGNAHEVRAVLINDEQHFVGKDVCDALGYSNPSDAMALHCKGVAKRYPLQTGGGMQNVRVLVEADVLRLIINSKLPAAEAFERWVFEEVLPSLRRSGAFIMTGARSPANPSTKIQGELAILECFTRLMRPAPSSQIAMLTKLAEQNALDPRFLPSYAIDAPLGSEGSSMETAPLTFLLQEHRIAIKAASYNQMLNEIGILARRSRPSTSPRAVDGVKHFWSITSSGLHYGKNVTSPKNQRETQPHWYVSRFSELNERVMRHLEKEGSEQKQTNVL